MKFPNYFSINRSILFGLLILTFCLVLACSKKNDDGTPPVLLSITSFSPAQGEVGTEVMVIGEGFSTVSDENTVTLGITPVTLKLAEAGKLKFDVPESASSGKISVTVGTESVTSSESFMVNAPVSITSFSPLEGEWGTQVTISGTNFSGSGNTVTFNGVEAEIIEENESQIVVNVPENSRRGKIEITNANDSSVESVEFFEVWYGKWTQLKNFEGGVRRDATAFVLNNKAYVGLGTNGTVFPNKDLWEYHLGTDSWTDTEQVLPGDGHLGCSSFVIGETAYVASGLLIGVGSVHPEIWTFDGNSWLEGDIFQGPNRYNAPSFVINGKGYYGTGYDENFEPLKDFWEYDPESGTWGKLAEVGEEEAPARYNAVGFALGNYGYIGTGYTTEDEISVKDFWEYNQESDTWTRIEDVGGEKGPTRASATSFAIDGKGYAGLGIGGDDEDTVHNDFWEYDPDRGSWVRIADFPGTARYHATAFVLDGKAYVGLGYDGGDELDDFWVFDPGN